MKHTFRIQKQNNISIDSTPDLRILLSAGYLNNRGRLRKYEKKAKEITIGQRVIKKSKNIAVRPGWKRIRTYVDIIKHTEKGTKAELDFTIEDMKPEEKSECRCQETVHAQLCYHEEFYDRSRLNHRRDNVVEDLNPWVNNELILKKGVNPAMNSFSVSSNRPLVPSEPGAIVSSAPHKKTGLFCGTTNRQFRDKIMERHGDRDLTKIIEKEINQLPERLSNKVMIGEQIEEELRRSYNTVACYIAGNPVIPPSMFTSFEKFGDVTDTIEKWKVKDQEQLVGVIYEDLQSWKEISCPWCFSVMLKIEFKNHYLEQHKDSLFLVNTCDLIKSNHRSYISFILFLILCLEDKIKISYSEEMNKLKQRIDDQNREREIHSEAPGYEELKQTHDLFVMKHFEKEKSWTDEVATLKEQLKTITNQTRKTRDVENEIKVKEKEVMKIKEKLENLEKQKNERIKIREQTKERKTDVEIDKSDYESKIKEIERKYREEKIKNAGLTRRINALETEKVELKQELEDATEFFYVLDDINEKLENKNKHNRRHIDDLNREIYEGEEHFEAIVEINDELIKETKDLKEINKTLKRENEQLEMNVEELENDWEKYREGDLEEMDNVGEFFMVIDEMMDARTRTRLVSF